MQELLKSAGTVTFHAMGAAIPRAIEIALEAVGESDGALQLSVNTSTMDVVDDLRPLDPQQRSRTAMRQVSAVHVSIFKVQR